MVSDNVTVSSKTADISVGPEVDMSKLLEELAQKYDRSIPEDSVTAEIFVKRMSENGQQLAPNTARRILKQEYDNGKLDRKRIQGTWYYYDKMQEV
jgi:hypothetical protein